MASDENWRRGRDSNPRSLAARLISSQLQSTTLPHLRKQDSTAGRVIPCAFRQQPSADSDFLKHQLGIPEGLRADFDFVHERHEEATELAVRLAGIIEHAASFDAAASPAEQDDRKLVVVVLGPGHHAGAI